MKNGLVAAKVKDNHANKIAEGPWYQSVLYALEVVKEHSHYRRFSGASSRYMHRKSKCSVNYVRYTLNNCISHNTFVFLVYVNNSVQNWSWLTNCRNWPNWQKGKILFRVSNFVFAAQYRRSYHWCISRSTECNYTIMWIQYTCAYLC